jgi:DNA repair exonuclease SbcCD ATPase subunit
MSMDLDKDDLAALCAGVTTDEVDRVHRLLHEWSIGPDSSFQVQLALLTKAQWRIAANLPRLMNDARKLIEAHLAEYRRQSQAMAEDFAGMVDAQNKELTRTVEIRIQATRQAAEQIQAQLAEAEAVSMRVKTLMESAASEWENIKASTTAQCERLEQVSNDLQDRFAWRVILRTVLWLLLAVGIGLCIGHNWIR